MSEMLLQSAQTAAQTGQLYEAVRLYHELLAAQPAHLQALYELGMIYFQATQYGEAEKAFGAAVSIDPNFVNAWCLLGIVLVKQKRAEEALQCFDRALTLKPDFLEGLINRATTLLDLGRHREGLEELDRVLALAPDNALSWNNRGNALLGLGRFREAVESYDKALSVFPDFPEARQNRLYALGELNREGPGFAEVLCAQGVEWMKRQRWVNALAAFDEALTLKPDYPEALAYRATTLREGVRHLFDECAPEFEQSMLNNLNYRGHLQVRELAETVWQGARSGLSIADLGCGTGLVGGQFRDWAAGGRLDGIDFAPRMIEEAKARGIYDNLVLSDLEPFLHEADETYDLLVTADTMIYISDLSNLFAGIARRLKPGGQFIFSLEAKHGEGYEETPKRRFRHSEAYLRQKAEEAGLRFVHIAPSTLRFETGTPVAGFTVAVQK